MKCFVVESFCMLRDSPDNLPDKRFRLVGLQHGKLFSCRFSYFQEGVASHLHDSRELFPHELEEFLDDCLQKAPIMLEKSWILTDYVHDARGNHSLVLFTFLVLAELQQSPERADKEGSFLAILNGSAERPNNPRQGIERIEIEILGLLLFFNLIQDELFHIVPVVSHQILSQLLLDLI